MHPFTTYMLINHSSVENFKIVRHFSSSFLTFFAQLMADNSLLYAKYVFIKNKTIIHTQEQIKLSKHK